MPSNLLLLLDDIASVLDDVATMTKIATKKTAGVLGDDLALNAEQVTGMTPNRELPVVWAVAKGSFLNKAILVPAAIAISAFAPWLIIPLLMIGGAFLCYEGFEKVVHKLLHGKEEKQHHAEHVAAMVDPKVDLVEFEKSRIKGAVRTDFILSAEIMVIALGTAKDAPLLQKALLLTLIGVVFTVFVYGLVAGIVKLDDLGLALQKRASSVARTVGSGILRAAPWLMKSLALAGTVAMFLVGGGIIAHGVPFLHHLSESFAAKAGPLAFLAPTLFNALVGIVLGGVLVVVITLGTRIFKRGATAKQPRTE